MMRRSNRIAVVHRLPVLTGLAALCFFSCPAAAKEIRSVGAFDHIGLEHVEGQQQRVKKIMRNSLASLLSAAPVDARHFSRLAGTGVAPGPSLQQAEDSILVAVEKTASSGKVERKEAVLSIEEDDVVSSKNGIAISLGDDKATVRVLATSVGISVQPSSIRFEKAGTSAFVEIDDLTGATSSQPVHVYPRDASRVHWDKSSRTLTALTPDTSTEIYIARAGQLVVVPVVTGNPAPSKTKQMPGQLALPPELARLPVQEKADLATLASTEDGIDAASAPAKTSLSIHASSEQVGSTSEAQLPQAIKLRRAAVAATRSALRLKVSDERASSSPSTGNFPIGGVQVYVAGAEFSAISDARGEINLSDIPANSSLLVVTNDPGGNYVPSTARVHVGGNAAAKNARVERQIIIPRMFTFDAWTRMAGVVQSPASGSLCVDFASGPAAKADGISVKVDVRANGPFYFNSDGIMDHTATSTSGNGRVCYFNVEPGPVNLSAWQGSAQIMAREFPVLSGRHSHDKAIVHSIVQGSYAQFARESAAHEQLGGDAGLQSYVLEDAQDAVLVATTQKLFVAGDHLQGAGSLVSSEGSSEVVYVDNPDFEPAIYRLSSGGPIAHVNVLPVLPRGFVEDMAVYAQTSQDFTSGSVLVEFADFHGRGQDKVEFRLVNEVGHIVGEPWVFSGSPLGKALFFNVPPGVYGLVVESPRGEWLAAETVSVYGEATSIVQSGSKLSAWFNPDTHH